MRREGMRRQGRNSPPHYGIMWGCTMKCKGYRVIKPIPQWDGESEYPRERMEWLIDLCNGLEAGDRTGWKRFYLTEKGFECLYPYGTGGQDCTAHFQDGKLLNIIGPDLKHFDSFSRRLRGIE